MKNNHQLLFDPLLNNCNEFSRLHLEDTKTKEKQRAN